MAAGFGRTISSTRRAATWRTLPVKLSLLLLGLTSGGEPLPAQRPARGSPLANGPAGAADSAEPAGFAPLGNSSIRSEREYATLCGSAKAACGAFDAELRAYSDTVHSTVGAHGRVLLLYDEFKPVGLSQHWAKRQLALWLGMALRRAVFFSHCDDTGRFARMRRCDARPPHFDMEEHFGLRGGASLAWTAEVAASAAAAGARHEVVLGAANWSLAGSEPLASEQFISLRLCFSPTSVLAARRALFGEARGALLRGGSALLRSERCFKQCSGFAVTRPSAPLATLVAPVARRLRAASARVGLHVRTLAADAPVCFPDATPPTARAVDAAFGNDACMRGFYEHWRFKLVPARDFRGAAACPSAHLADVTPLSGWLRCAARLLPPGSAGSAGSEPVQGGAAAGGPAGDGSVAVFLSTDAPALHRYASRPEALGGAPRAALLALGANHSIAHTHQRPRGVQLSDEAVRSAHARGAADWYLLTLSDVLLAPIESAFADTVCVAHADAQACALLSPRTTFRSVRGPGVCALSACFPEAIRCGACRWRSEFMGEVMLRRSTAVVSTGVSAAGPRPSAAVFLTELR